MFNIGLIFTATINYMETVDDIRYFDQVCAPYIWPWNTINTDIQVNLKASLILSVYREYRREALPDLKQRQGSLIYEHDWIFYEPQSFYINIYEQSWTFLWTYWRFKSSTLRVHNECKVSLLCTQCTCREQVIHDKVLQLSKISRKC